MDGVLILALETATGCGGVSLTLGGMHGGRLLAECTCQPEVSHSRRLLGSVQWIMAAAGVSWNDLDGIGVSLGPGSFTGLRIGMAAAKSIAMAAGKPLVGVPTLDALAFTCTGSDRLLGCLLDARKQEVYAGFYRIGADGNPRSLGVPMAISPADLAGRITEPVLLAGPGAAVYRELFAGFDSVRILPAPFSALRAATVGFIAGDMLGQGRTMDPATAAPLYVRASEAELNFLKAGGRAGETAGKTG
ncbi:tRNA threonylcarbamoyladenosine biosynthesis protein TsaB [bacterium BMS3Bbin14]|nr:tRNA threonylcarbamoyladenosine biosynthesis protein TsaB [bacterium BMS3Abin13]GBE52266.1 tRNA threonylcarbamoyladenosine biosynthesis protein TsaB [bacterium BMS3Bbin14]HDO30309.1 tRNA (adenosine(37)-N6)-threonylcarbamoyltransferase complex dimerization subunit type 1 TsaB [Desulfobacteraceae bacterium]